MNSNKLLKLPDPETMLDKMVAYETDLSGTVALNDQEKELNERIAFAYDHLRAQYQDKDVTAFLQKRFKCSRSSAYNYIRAARKVHGNVNKIDLNFELYDLLQISLLAIKWAKDDHNYKDLTKAIEARTKILSLVKHDDKIDWSKVQPNNYFLILNQNNSSGEGLKIDFRNMEKLTMEQLNEVQNSVDDHFDNELVEILESKINGHSEQSPLPQ